MDRAMVVALHMGTQVFHQGHLQMLLGALRWLIEIGVDLLTRTSCNKLFLLVTKGLVLGLLGCSCFSSRILMILYDLVGLYFLFSCWGLGLIDVLEFSWFCKTIRELISIWVHWMLISCHRFQLSFFELDLLV
jgi:hypothetical protein